MAGKENSQGGLGCIFTLAFFAFIVYVGWNAADTAGYLDHRIETQITVSPNWLLGETKACNSPVLHALLEGVERYEWLVGQKVRRICRMDIHVGERWDEVS